MNFLLLAWSSHAGLPSPLLTNIVFISAFNIACMFYNSYYLPAQWFTLLTWGYLTKTLLCPDHTLVTIYCLVVATEAQQPINPFAPGDFAQKRVLKLVEWFSGHCRAIKS